MRKTVGKLIANQACEALQEVMNHLQEWSMNLDGVSAPDRPGHLRADYGRVRRLRDYFRNLIRAHALPVVDLDDEDSNQLVSCCMFSAENIETYMQKNRVNDAQKKWMQDNLSNLYWIAMEFATAPVKLIDGPGHHKIPTNDTRRILNKINARVAESRAASCEENKSDEEPVETNLAWDSSANVEEEAGDNMVVAQPLAAARGDSTPNTGSVPANLLDLDTQMVKDPRLRSILLMDLKALSLAMHAKDSRLSSIVLSAVFESVVADIALQNRSELGLQGTPDGWNLSKVVPAILGGRSSAPDRNTLFHLLSCKNLVRPTVQLTNPIVVTKQTLEKMLDFVRRFLVETGLSGSRAPV